MTLEKTGMELAGGPVSDEAARMERDLQKTQVSMRSWRSLADILAKEV